MNTFQKRLRKIQQTRYDRLIGIAEDCGSRTVNIGQQIQTINDNSTSDVEVLRHFGEREVAEDSGRVNCNIISVIL